MVAGHAIECEGAVVREHLAQQRLWKVLYNVGGLQLLLLTGLEDENHSHHLRRGTVAGDYSMAGR